MARPWCDAHLVMSKLYQNLPQKLMKLVNITLEKKKKLNCPNFVPKQGNFLLPKQSLVGGGKLTYCTLRSASMLIKRITITYIYIYKLELKLYYFHDQ